MTSFEYVCDLYPAAAYCFHTKDGIYELVKERHPDAPDFYVVKALAVQTGEHRVCIDCRTRTDDEYYMVQDEIWQDAVGWGSAGEICIGCLEKRLGRRLVAADFTGAPVNDPEMGKKSERLLNRLDNHD